MFLTLPSLTLLVITHSAVFIDVSPSLGQNKVTRSRELFYEKLAANGFAIVRGANGLEDWTTPCGTSYVNYSVQNTGEPGDYCFDGKGCTNNACGRDDTDLDYEYANFICCPTGRTFTDNNVKFCTIETGEVCEKGKQCDKQLCGWEYYNKEVDWRGDKICCPNGIGDGFCKQEVGATCRYNSHCINGACGWESYDKDVELRGNRICCPNGKGGDFCKQVGGLNCRYGRHCISGNCAYEYIKEFQFGVGVCV